MDTFMMVVLGGAVAGCALVIRSYNRLISLHRRCQRAEADIDAQLQHRYSLVPQLVETVRGFLKQESNMFAQLISAYEKALAATTTEQKVQAENLVSANLMNVLQSLERYPELQSSSHFHRLREDLLDVEQKLTAARRFLNLAADEYNAALARFPGVLFARVLGMKPYRYYSVGADRPIVEQHPAISF